MENEDKNQLLFNASVGYLDEHINQIQEMLAYGLNLPVQEIKISFPSLKNFYSTYGDGPLKLLYDRLKIFKTRLY